MSPSSARAESLPVGHTMGKWGGGRKRPPAVLDARRAQAPPSLPACHQADAAARSTHAHAGRDHVPIAGNTQSTGMLRNLAATSAGTSSPSS